MFKNSLKCSKIPLNWTKILTNVFKGFFGVPGAPEYFIIPPVCQVPQKILVLIQPEESWFRAIGVQRVFKVGDQVLYSYNRGKLIAIIIFLQIQNFVLEMTHKKIIRKSEKRKKKILSLFNCSGCRKSPGFSTKTEIGCMFLRAVSNECWKIRQTFFECCNKFLLENRAGKNPRVPFCPGNFFRWKLGLQKDTNYNGNVRLKLSDSEPRDIKVENHQQRQGHP